MKKRFICLVLAAVLLCLPGCAQKDSLTGTWEAEVDALQAVLPNLPDGLSMLQLGALDVTLQLTFTEESFTLSVEPESIQRAVDGLRGKAEKLLEGKESDAQGIMAYLEGMLGAAADKLKENWEQLLEDADIEGKVNAAFHCNGTYEYDGKQLVLTDEEGNTFLSSKCVLLGKKLTLTKPFSGVALLTFQKNTQ